MKFPDPLQSGRLLKREKRFLVHVRLDDGSETIAHTNNTGSIRGCSLPGNRVWLSPADNPQRKLAWTLELIAVDDDESTLVGVNTLLANKLAREGIETGVIVELAGYDRLRTEVRPPASNSRLDLLLESGPESAAARTWVEVKNVTYREGDVALFPDAVTTRGRKHLLELARLVAGGDRAVLLFVVQREDVQQIGPADRIDPEYGQATAPTPKIPPRTSSACSCQSGSFADPCRRPPVRRQLGHTGLRVEEH
ncbi:MAG: DNA/RNA nuclease SfsA [bacterium]